VTKSVTLKDTSYINRILKLCKINIATYEVYICFHLLKITHEKSETQNKS